MGFLTDCFKIYSTTRIVRIRSKFLALTYLTLVILVWCAFLGRWVRVRRIEGTIVSWQIHNLCFWTSVFQLWVGLSQRVPEVVRCNWLRIDESQRSPVHWEFLGPADWNQVAAIVPQNLGCFWYSSSAVFGKRILCTDEFDYNPESDFGSLSRGQVFSYLNFLNQHWNRSFVKRHLLL